MPPNNLNLIINSLVDVSKNLLLGIIVIITAIIVVVAVITIIEKIKN
jgi:hypothetical protein